MKFLKVLLVLFLLTGCENIYDQVLKPYDLSGELDKIFLDTSKSAALINNYSTYMDFYLPYELNEYSSDKISNVYALNNGKIIMNINISAIINGTYYNEGFFDSDKLIYEHEGYFTNENDRREKYLFNLYRYDEQYLLYFVSKDVNFYGYTCLNEVVLMARKILDVAKSVSVAEDAIVSTYSNSAVIDYRKSYVDLFKTIMPVAGRIDDLMVDENSQVSDE